MKRNYSTSTAMSPQQWSVITGGSFQIQGTIGVTVSYTNTLGENQFKAGDQIAFLAMQDIDYAGNPLPTPPTVTFTATMSLYIPESPKQVTINAIYNSEITPQYPENIKQYDFLKSLMLMHNLYAYTEKKRPKHIIFESYDSFYALTNPQYLSTTALDWSNKIVYNENWKKTLNYSIPKSYVYTFKEDKDAQNEDYKNSFNQIYGQLKFSDDLGTESERKVELIFSPSPMITLGEIQCAGLQKDSLILSQSKPTNTNIRLLYYNGEKSVNNRYNVIYSDFNGNLGTANSNPVGYYGQAMEYSMNEDPYSPTPIVIGSPNAVLQFALPKRLYSGLGLNYINTPNLYENYYIDQVTELTNPNLNQLECSVWLTEIDIANFDFRTPIFIQTDIGNSYYKVLELSWKSSKIPAKVKLQSINLERVVTTSTPATFSCVSCSSWYYDNNFSAIDGTLQYFSCVDGSTQSLYVPGNDVFGTTGSFCNCDSVGLPTQIIGTGITFSNQGVCVSTTTTTTTAQPCVTGTTLNITDTGWFRYDLCDGTPTNVFAGSLGTYTITDCHKCGTIRYAFPLSDLAAWNNVVCGTASC